MSCLNTIIPSWVSGAEYHSRNVANIAKILCTYVMQVKSRTWTPKHTLIRSMASQQR